MYIYIYIYEKSNLIKRFKLHNYNIVLYKWRKSKETKLDRMD